MVLASGGEAPSVDDALRIYDREIGLMVQHGTEAVSDLWASLNVKFCDDLRQAFSARDIDGWLGHFYRNRKVDVLQFGQDVTGKAGTGKTVHVYTGGWLGALKSGRLPMKVMAKVLFKRLSDQGYSRSHIDLLGVRFVGENEMRAEALVSFERINHAGEAYASAVVVYCLEWDGNEWLITKLSNYDAIEDLPSENAPASFWRP